MEFFDCPDDFDDYWNHVLVRLKKVPLNAKELLNPLHSNEFCNCYEVFFLSFDSSLFLISTLISSSAVICSSALDIATELST